MSCNEQHTHVFERQNCVSHKILTSPSLLLLLLLLLLLTFMFHNNPLSIISHYVPFILCFLGGCPYILIKLNFTLYKHYTHTHTQSRVCNCSIQTQTHIQKVPHTHSTSTCISESESSRIHFISLD